MLYSAPLAVITSNEDPASDTNEPELMKGQLMNDGQMIVIQINDEWIIDCQCQQVKKTNIQLQNILVLSGILGVFYTQSSYTHGNLSMHM